MYNNGINMAIEIHNMEISIKFKSIKTSSESSDLNRDAEFHRLITSREEAIRAVNEFFDSVQNLNVVIKS